MAKHQKTEEWHTCDICCEECEPVGTIEIPVAYSMDLVYTMQVRVSAYLPYGTTNGDVCFSCFKKYIQKWIADQERRRIK
jgi:hypothetical protein